MSGNATRCRADHGDRPTSTGVHVATLLSTATSNFPRFSSRSTPTTPRPERGKPALRFAVTPLRCRRRRRQRSPHQRGRRGSPEFRDAPRQPTTPHPGAMAEQQGARSRATTFQPDSRTRHGRSVSRPSPTVGGSGSGWGRHDPAAARPIDHSGQLVPRSPGARRRLTAALFSSTRPLIRHL